MRQKVAKELRKIAYNRWATLKPDYKKVISPRFIYKKVKEEFNNEKRRCNTATKRHTKRQMPDTQLV